jgi:hypothetical protein
VKLSPVAEADFNLSPDTAFQGLHHAVKVFEGDGVDLAPWKLQIKQDVDGIKDFKSLPVDAISELFLIINYLIR